MQHVRVHGQTERRKKSYDVLIEWNLQGRIEQARESRQRVEWFISWLG